MDEVNSLTFLQKTLDKFLDKNFKSDDPIVIALSERIAQIKNNKNTFSLQCPICLENETDSDNIDITPCAHKFHIECLSIWMKENSNCPLCRTEIDVQNYYQWNADEIIKDLIEKVLSEGKKFLIYTSIKRQIRLSRSKRFDMVKVKIGQEYKMDMHIDEAENILFFSEDIERYYSV